VIAVNFTCACCGKKEHRYSSSNFVNDFVLAITQPTPIGWSWVRAPGLDLLCCMSCTYALTRAIAEKVKVLRGEHPVETADPEEIAAAQSAAEPDLWIVENRSRR